MSKNLDMAELFDLYAPLLTDKQRETLEMYYNSDFSLGEISEETGKTRQAALNCIRNSEAKMLELEEKLGLYKRLGEISADADRLAMLSEKIPDGSVKDEIIAQIAHIKDCV